MKKLVPFLLATLIFIPLATRGAQTAQARLWCLSLRFQQGSSGFATLYLSTINGIPNGELTPTSGDYTHGSFFLLDDGFELYEGTMVVDVPDFGDANGNGFDDFFEVSQGGSGQTLGEFFGDFVGGTVTATWSRGSGSENGTCELSLEDDSYGPLGDFNHSFELIEYTGPLSYTPGSNAVSGGVNLAQTGNAANTFQGPIAFTKSATEPFDVLDLAPGVWTNAAMQTLSFHNYLDSFLRDPGLRTNYYGFVDFDDGDPNTGAADYYYWELSIDDANDADLDGIPDFSDHPQTAPPRRPTLSLTPGATNLWLTISGDVGHPYQVEEINSVNATNWQTVLSGTLTNDPQTVSLPPPSPLPKFWRVQVN